MNQILSQLIGQWEPITVWSLCQRERVNLKIKPRSNAAFWLSSDGYWRPCVTINSLVWASLMKQYGNCLTFLISASSKSLKEAVNQYFSVMKNKHLRHYLFTHGNTHNG